MRQGLRIISSMATRALLIDLANLWNARGGLPIACDSVGGVDAAKRVAAGEPYDMVVLARDAIDRLVTAGHAIAATKTDLARSSVAIAARQGDRQPPIGDEEALRAAVGAARRVAISTGPSGDAIQRLFARWGMTASLDDRLVQAPPGIPVGSLLAEGAADIGFQQLSELRDFPGIEVLGLMPPGLEVATTFSAACCSRGAHRQDAVSILRFWNSPNVSELKMRHGMDPVVR